MRDYESEEKIRKLRRDKRRAELRRRERQRRRRIKALLFGCAVLIIILLCMIAGKVLSGKKEAVSEEKQQEEMIQEESEDSTRPDNEETPDQTEVSDETESETEAEETDETALPFASGYTPEATSSTVDVNGEVLSNYALLVDLDENVIVAQRNARERISPASMTKILTVLVAAEHITDLDDTFTITTEITDYSYRNDCSAAGFVDGETVTVKDLLYGTILPSGADAAAGLAYYVAGSLDGFVELMNEKIEELGLSDTAHFTNCVGLYDENHYCTVYDMAMMLKAAVENDLCREVLSAHTYTTSSTEQHPDGLELSNWFLRRIEDKDTKGEVVCAKTGFVAQSGSCAASYEITESGKHYICVTADTYSSWRCIYDHVAMYQQYTD